MCGHRLGIKNKPLNKGQQINILSLFKNKNKIAIQQNFVAKIKSPLIATLDHKKNKMVVYCTHNYKYNYLVNF